MRAVSSYYQLDLEVRCEFFFETTFIKRLIELAFKYRYINKALPKMSQFCIVFFLEDLSITCPAQNRCPLLIMRGLLGPSFVFQTQTLPMPAHYNCCNGLWESYSIRMDWLLVKYLPPLQYNSRSSGSQCGRDNA